MTQFLKTILKQMVEGAAILRQNTIYDIKSVNQRYLNNISYTKLIKIFNNYNALINKAHNKYNFHFFFFQSLIMFKQYDVQFDRDDVQYNNNMSTTLNCSGFTFF